MDIKIDQNFRCVLNGFLVVLGANKVPLATLLGPQDGGDEWGSNALLRDFLALGAKMAPKTLQEGHGDQF